jgi:hypothetical protein
LDRRQANDSLTKTNKLLGLPMPHKSEKSSPKRDFLINNDIKLRVCEQEEEKENDLEDIDVVNPLINKS